VNEFDPGGPKSVIEQIKGKKRDESSEGHHLPTVPLDFFIQALPSRTSEFALDPIPGNIARDKEG
jgi:hypothetical protein